MLGQNLNWVMMGDTATLISSILYITAAHNVLMMGKRRQSRERERERRWVFFVTSPSHMNTSTASLPAGERSPGSTHRKLSKPAQCSLIFHLHYEQLHKVRDLPVLLLNTAEKWSDNGCFFNYRYIREPCVVFLKINRFQPQHFCCMNDFKSDLKTCNCYS